MAHKSVSLCYSLIILSATAPISHAWVGRISSTAPHPVTKTDTTLSRRFVDASRRRHDPMTKLSVHQSVDLESASQSQEFEFHVQQQQPQHHQHQELQLLAPTGASASSMTDDDSQITMTDTKIDANIETVLNGLLLAVCFGYAAFTILNIDHGMTRGWTQSEIAMRIPLDNWNNYETALAEKPIYTKTLINVVIYLLGDWLSQTLFQGKNALEFDAVRTLRNGLIGLGFGPLVHEYYQFSDHILPVEGGMLNRLEKILMDQTIYLTVKCSIYIMAVGLLSGDDFESAVNNVKSRIKDIVLTAWKFWPLVHCVTYGLIPARHRILWVNCVDLVWNAILATMSRSSPAPVDEPVADEAVEISDATILSLSVNATDTVLDPFFLAQDLLPTAAFDSTMELFEEVQEDFAAALGDSRNGTVSLAS